MADPVEYESRGPVVTLWLNRPEVKNAYDLGLLEALADGLTRAEEDEDARLVVVSGRGDAFCAYTTERLTFASFQPRHNRPPIAAATLTGASRRQNLSVRVRVVPSGAVARLVPVLFVCDSKPVWPRWVSFWGFVQSRSPVPAWRPLAGLIRSLSAPGGVTHHSPAACGLHPQTDTGIVPWKLSEHELLGHSR